MIGGMALRELVSDLKDVADRLAAVTADGDDPVISGPVKAGVDACSKVERAWSRSWLGYHSRVYYADFAPPPPGARFSSEWGFLPAFGNSTRGDWREYRYEDVIDAIEEIAATPDLSVAQDYEKRAQAAWRTARRRWSRSSPPCSPSTTIRLSARRWTRRSPWNPSRSTASSGCRCQALSCHGTRPR